MNIDEYFDILHIVKSTNTIYNKVELRQKLFSQLRVDEEELKW